MSSTPTGATRPNVVLIMADQLRWDAVGAYWPEGQSPVRTPHLDRIAREGVRCDRAYTSSPICMPARASVLTGRWPHAHRLWDNGVRFPPQTTTLATVLAQHGYRTGIAGKGHLDVHHLLESPDSYVGGWDTPEAIAAGGKDGWHGPYYGFQQAQLTCGHNRPCGHYGTWLYKEHPDAVRLMEREHALEPLPGGAWKSALPVELHASTWIGDRSVEFVRRGAATGGATGRDRDAQPFFLWASFPDPHPPFCPPKDYADRYDPAAMPAPLRRAGELDDKPPHFCDRPDMHEPGMRDGAPWRPYGEGHLADPSRTDAVDAVRKAAYYAMTELVDHNVGRILAALEETGQLDNTIVAVIADHGELLGDHWLDGKGPWHYDGCTRVPLLVRYPAAFPAGHVVREFVSQCDVAPTICDLAGVPYTTWPPQFEEYASGRIAEPGVLPDVQGMSLVPALRGAAPARPHVLMETEWRWNPGLHLKTLRTPDWRLTVYAGRPYGELYDLRADPEEFANRWDDPACRTARADLTALLLQEILQTEGRLPPRVVENELVAVVDDAQAEAFLVDRFGGDAGEIVRVGYGEWSKAYAFRRAGAPYIIRFSAHQEDFAKDRLAARWSSPDLPIPQIVELGEAFGGFYAISERVAGGFIDDLTQEQFRAVLPALFRALDAARHVDLSASSGYGGWDASGNAPHPTWRAALLDVAYDRPADRTHGWRERLVTSPTGAGPFDEAFEQLQTLVDACPDGAEARHVIHSDLLHFNVLVSGERISAVIDWGCSMYGDFLYDIAWFLCWWPWYPAWHGIDFPREVARHYASIGLRVSNIEERLRCYQVHIGLAGQAYCAFTGNWADLEATARRTLEVARSSR